jgi:hypothetical protein
MKWNLFARFIPRRKPVTVAVARKDPPRERDLASVLEAEEGVVEIPAYSNWGKRVEEYLRSAGINFPQPWCAAFVHWGMAQIGKRGYGAFCPNWFVPMLEVGEPVRNAWGLVWFPKLDRYAHIFVVTKVFPNGMIETIEGNTNNDGSREGTGVFRRLRSSAAHRFFVSR